ncbi:MAG: LysR family transcriptional regulator [Kofleriaceae bacterium]|nr:LysR family transcriptional regulator [Kofleriaceae bacterium]
MRDSHTDASHAASVEPALLIALDAILQTRNLTTAARRHGVTPSAMSHKLRLLRAQLGDPLLVRGARGMVRTTRAEALAAPLRRALAALDDALAQQEDFDPASARRRFILSTSDYGEAVVMPKVMAHLAHAAPGIDIEIVAPTPDLGERLERGTLDAVVAPAGPPMPAGTRRRAFVREGFGVALRAGHPARRRWNLATYLALGHVLIVPRGERGSIVDDLLAARGHERRTVVRMPSFASAPAVVAETDLCLTAPTGLLAAARRNLPLVVLPPPFELPPLAIYLYWHERVDLDPAQVWFREMLATVGASVLAGSDRLTRTRRGGPEGTRGSPDLR